SGGNLVPRRGAVLRRRHGARLGPATAARGDRRQHPGAARPGHVGGRTARPGDGACRRERVGRVREGGRLMLIKYTANGVERTVYVHDLPAFSCTDAETESTSPVEEDTRARVRRLEGIVGNLLSRQARDMKALEILDMADIRTDDDRPVEVIHDEVAAPV